MTPQPNQKRILLPILLTCLGYACYNVNDAGLKVLLKSLHFSQIMVFASVLNLVFMILYGVLREGKKIFRTNKPKLMFWRGLLSQVSYLINLCAFPHLQLTTFYTLVFTCPFWITLLNSWYYKEKLDKRRLGVILFGFGVVLFIFHPGGALFNVWSLLILVSCVVYAVQMLMVREIGSAESRALMFSSSAVMSIAIGLALLGNHYVPLTVEQWGVLTFITFIAVIGLLCVSYAFQEAPSAAVVAPYHYTQLIWGAVLGYYIFGDVPKVETVIGAVLIILAGLYLIRHERRKAALRPPEA